MGVRELIRGVNIGFHSGSQGRCRPGGGVVPVSGKGLTALSMCIPRLGYLRGLSGFGAPVVR